MTSWGGGGVGGVMQSKRRGLQGGPSCSTETGAGPPDGRGEGGFSRARRGRGWRPRRAGTIERVRAGGRVAFPRRGRDLAAAGPGPHSPPGGPGEGRASARVRGGVRGTFRGAVRLGGGPRGGGRGGPGRGSRKGGGAGGQWSLCVPAGVGRRRRRCCRRLGETLRRRCRWPRPRPPGAESSPGPQPPPAPAPPRLRPGVSGPGEGEGRAGAAGAGSACACGRGASGGRGAGLAT